MERMIPGCAGRRRLNPALVVVACCALAACRSVTGGDAALENSGALASSGAPEAAGGAGQAPADTSPGGLFFDHAAWLVDLAEWRSERDASLRAEDGYLSLVGLHWLDEGRHGFGSDPENDLVLPAGRVPARGGTLVVEQGRVHAELEPGVTALLDGQPVADVRGERAPASRALLGSRVDLASDAEGAPNRLAFGDVTLWIIDRAGRLGVRVRDPASPLRAAFDGVDAFVPDPAWRVEARFEPHLQRMLAVPNIMGTTYEDTSIGMLAFEREGRTWRLQPTGDGLDSLFLIFGDETNGGATYGGGRFLRVGAPDERGRVLLDFNRAYNPPCAFTPFTTCPLPPEGNVLPFSVRAGEKAPRQH